MSKAVPQSDEIDLIELWQIVRSNKQRIFKVAALFIFLSLLVAIFTPQVYRGNVLFVPVETSGKSNGGLSSLASSFGGVAGLAGINIGGQASSKEANLAILESKRFTEEFIRKYDIRPHLFPERWDEKKQKWLKRDDLLFVAKKMLRDGIDFLSGAKTKRPDSGDYSPTVLEVQEVFSEIRTVNVDSLTGLATLSIDWEDPELAAQWANDMVRLANEFIRNKDIREGEKSIEYLRQKIETETLPQVKVAFSSLIEEQLKQNMLAYAKEGYAFEIIDPAYVPEERVRPRRGLIMVLGTILGLMSGVFWVFFRNFIAPDRGAQNVQGRP
tara:strand:+ start:11003 stop:11983 length:981 start_codon:yes stop_codon:yes gene_type:complete